MQSDSDIWGDQNTHFFYELTPDVILGAVEALDFRCTGRYLALNSMENRVYEVEIEVDGVPASPSDRFVVVKFYRPHRWTEAQIIEEHDFLLDLADEDLPVIAPFVVDDDTLFQVEGTEIFYTVFPKRGGRVLDEVTDELAMRLGRLLGRIHNVGTQFGCEERLTLTPDIFGRKNLEYLLNTDTLPGSIRNAYQKTVEEICRLSDPLFADIPVQRIHGDCHIGNILLHPDEGLRIVDFDDMVIGPCVQDIWLLTPEQGDYGTTLRHRLLDGYSEFRSFDYSTLNLVEPLRALRYIHFTAWIARRWDDPAFPNAFPQFGSDSYWEEQLADLRNQLALIREVG